MDCKRDKITLYSPQSSQVAEIIRREGVCFSRPEFISKKYGESAPLFLTAYSWFVREAAKIVPPPPGASFPYWAVADPKSVDRSAGGELLVLSVPADQVILFDLYDWNKILQLRPLTDDPREEKELLQELSLRGLDLNKVMLSSFYPDFREQILASWQRLFRHHQALLQGIAAALGRCRRRCGASAASGCFSAESLSAAAAALKPLPQKGQRKGLSSGLTGLFLLRCVF